MVIIAREELERAKLQQDIILKVVAQIQKDFQWYNENIELPDKIDNPYNNLFQQVFPIISRMLNLDSVRFFALLYAIDISEAKVKDILFGTKEVDAGEEITHLILERELQKVLTRIAYSEAVNGK